MGFDEANTRARFICRRLISCGMMCRRTIGRMMMGCVILCGAIVCCAIVCCARAQACSVDVVMVKGRVEHANGEAKVRVQLIYSKEQPGESAETTVEHGRFGVPIEFLTQSRRPLLNNLGEKCDRKPKSVVITLLESGQEQDRVSLDFARDFKMRFECLRVAGRGRVNRLPLKKSGDASLSSLGFSAIWPAIFCPLISRSEKGRQCEMATNIVP